MSNILVRLTAPFVIWFWHFSIVYGAHAILCASHDGSTHRLLVVLATAVAISLLVAMLIIALRFAADRAASAIATLLALVAVLWTALPALVLESCVSLSG